MPELEFIRFDSSNCAFPRPAFGLLPDVSCGVLGGNQYGSWSPVFDNCDATQFVRGRYALREAYRQGCRGAGLVFLPAYHCRTMVDPAIDLELQPIFYPVLENLSPNFCVLNEIFRANVDLLSGKNESVLVLPHYFGFWQLLDQLEVLCRQYGVKIIQDCSHALIRDKDFPSRVVDKGDFLIASPYKFFGTEDGGILQSIRSPDNSIQLKHPSWYSESKAWVRLVLKRLFKKRKDCFSDLRGFDFKVSELRDKPGIKGENSVHKYCQPSVQFLRAEIQQTSLAASRWLIAHLDVNNMAESRRANYMRWVECVAELPGCRALFPELQEDCVPYMFPVLLDDPDTHFYLLKRVGVPIGRWDEIAVSDCEVANRYRINLIHLPCYQGLSSAAMNWLTTAFSTVMLSSKKIS